MKKLIGKVKSISGKNSAVVTVVRRWRHPLYDKAVKRDKKYHCHYDGLDLKVGDQVAILPSRPMSKLKRFKVVSVIEKVKE